MKIIKLLVLIILLILVSIYSFVGDDEWKIIVEKKVSYKSEIDIVNFIISSCYSYIKVKCMYGIVNFKSIKVIMNNGEEKVFENLGVLIKGMLLCSLSLLDKNDVKFDKIKFEYEFVGSIVFSMVGVIEKVEVEIFVKKVKKDD